MASIERYCVEADEGWEDWIKACPWLSFPPEWQVKIIPPFGGLGVRFRIRAAENPKHEISVYGDFNGSAGAMSQPYWEIYPIDGDCARYYLGETDELIAGIAKALAASPT